MPVQVLPTTTNHWKMLTNTTDSSLDQNQVKEMLNQKFPICICKNFCKGLTWLSGTCAPQETLMKVCCWPISCEKWAPPFLLLPCRNGRSWLGPPPRVKGDVSALPWPWLTLRLCAQLLSLLILQLCFSLPSGGNWGPTYKKSQQCFWWPDLANGQ